jgi:soluble lytic murein transglycosylase-like protein
MSAWDTVQEKLQNPVVAGLAIATVGTAAFFGIRALVRPDHWGRPGDSCPVEIYVDKLGETKGTRAWHYMPWVRHAADAFGIDPTLLAGLIQTESAWKADAGSGAGALGLSQHIASTALSRYEKLVADGMWPFGPISTTGDPKEAYYAEHGAPGAIDRTDPKQSLWLGAASLAGVLKAGKGVQWALAAYNAGPAAANDPPWPAETQAYVPGVLKRQRSFQQIAEQCGAGALA